MTESGLAGLNLNLLVHLDALLEDGNVTRAAQRVGVTQSAMSHSLAKLRELLDDELVVRRGRRAELTPRAQALQLPLKRTLTDLHRLVRARGRFEPRRIERAFQVACPDFLQVVMGPAAAARFGREAPKASLELLPTERRRHGAMLEAGELDAALGAVLMPAPGLRRAKLYAESFVAVVRKGHPRVRKRLTLETYVALDHALITLGESSGPTWVDDQLRLRGLSRRVVVRTRSFLAAPILVAQSDLVVTAPRRLCEHMARRYPLALFEPPIPLPGYDEELLWHERFDDDPAHKWMRAVLSDAAARA